jgi:hypothetical protein
MSTKRSIFLELPHWNTNLLRHNLDVMHIEKNMFENNIMQFFTRKMRGCNIFFNSANKEIFYILSIPVMKWQEATVAIKKEALPPFASVNALLFSM